jgi:outer membrane protein assembly factor BamB
MNCLLLTAGFFDIATIARADDWPQFRGPDGQGHAVAANPPLCWTEDVNVRWKVPIVGQGWSSPVVQGDQIWLTTAVETPGSAEQLRAAIARVGAPVPSPHVAGDVQLRAICLDRASGQTRHDVTLFDVADPIVICTVNSYASPTPVLDGQRLVCDFGALGTACIDTRTGQPIWKRSLVIEHQVGAGSSPITFGDRLILVRDGCDVQYVTALDTVSGQTLWRTNRPPLSTSVAVYRKAFSTPLVFRHDGTEQMVVVGAQWVVSYDPASGRELWRVDTGETFSNSSRPVYGQGLVFVCTAYGGSKMLAIRPDGQGDVTETHVAWELKRSIPKRSSPLLVGEQLYRVSDDGIASCVQARTGEIHWTQRLSGPHSASPLLAAGRIHFFGEDGTTTVVRPGTRYDPLAENRVNGRIMATPAVVDDEIFLRTDTHLYRVQGE